MLSIFKPVELAELSDFIFYIAFITIYLPFSFKNSSAIKFNLSNSKKPIGFNSYCLMFLITSATFLMSSDVIFRFKKSATA